MISIYLFDGEGLTQRNRAILHRAGEIIRKHKEPWLIAGDFNCTPQDLQDEMRTWLKELGGEIRAPGNLTCRSATGGRTIDFFIVGRRLLDGVEGVWVQVDFPSSPHYMVVMRLKSTITRAMVSKIIPPTPFDAHFPIGCLHPPAPVEDETDLILKLSNEGEVWEFYEKLITGAERQCEKHF